MAAPGSIFRLSVAVLTGFDSGTYRLSGGAFSLYRLVLVTVWYFANGDATEQCTLQHTLPSSTIDIVAFQMIFANTEATSRLTSFSDKNQYRPNSATAGIRGHRRHMNVQLFTSFH
jgi:hypothetical protein